MLSVVSCCDTRQKFSIHIICSTARNNARTVHVEICVDDLSLVSSIYSGSCIVLTACIYSLVLYTSPFLFLSFSFISLIIQASPLSLLSSPDFVLLILFSSDLFSFPSSFQCLQVIRFRQIAESFTIRGTSLLLFICCYRTVFR